MSPHIGDLDSVESLEYFHATLARYEELFRITPEVAVRDLHPGYLSTRVAEELGLSRTIAVQHHHAHIAAVAAEHGVTTPVVGLAFDGTGLGDDGHVWGAETLVADLNGYRRVAQLRYVPLPGGDLAAREPWRVALGYLSLEPGVADALRAGIPRHRGRPVDHCRAADRAPAERTAGVVDGTAVRRRDRRARPPAARQLRRAGGDGARIAGRRAAGGTIHVSGARDR